MDWTPITSLEQIDTIKERSKIIPQLIFKHSTRCSISSMVKNRLEKSNPPENVEFYCLDLISYRTVSSKIAEIFNIYHESPQVLLIKNSECMYEESHNAIRMEFIAENV